MQIILEQVSANSVSVKWLSDQDEEKGTFRLAISSMATQFQFVTVISSTRSTGVWLQGVQPLSMIIFKVSFQSNSTC